MNKIKPEIKAQIVKAMNKAQGKIIDLEPDKMSLIVAVVQATTFITLMGGMKNFYRWRVDMGFSENPILSNANKPKAN